jgi:AbrB family looped-hinge helix DNA binding protein
VRVRVDEVGRVVIPKAVRVALGITTQTELELVTDGAGLRLEPVVDSERPIGEEDGLPILAAVPGEVLTDDDVRNLRDAAQR